MSIPDKQSLYQLGEAIDRPNTNPKEMMLIVQVNRIGGEWFYKCLRLDGKILWYSQRQITGDST